MGRSDFDSAVHIGSPRHQMCDRMQVLLFLCVRVRIEAKHTHCAHRSVQPVFLGMQIVYLSEAMHKGHRRISAVAFIGKNIEISNLSVGRVHSPGGYLPDF